MEALLHWDFSPGLAVAAQVRRLFNSQVHFSPSGSSKEFFLVVSFSSACFDLSEETVGLVLQCVLGGDSLGFRVFQLSDRRFRFSVASNKVGHFVYGLKDRVWPDFVCHFSLFCGVPPSSSVSQAADCWLQNSFSAKKYVSSDQQHSVAIKPNLDVLWKSSNLKNSQSTAAKSGRDASHSGSAVLNSPPTVPSKAKAIFLCGEFPCYEPASLEGVRFPPRFAGRNFWQKWKGTKLPFPSILMDLILDQREAGYEDADIEVSLNFFGLPSSQTIKEILGYCTFCTSTLHSRAACPMENPPVMIMGPCGPLSFMLDPSLSGPLRCCFRCLDLGHIKSECSKPFKCVGCFGTGHRAKKCPVNPLCARCNQLGHLAEFCPSISCYKCGKAGHQGAHCIQQQIWIKKGSQYRSYGSGRCYSAAPAKKSQRQYFEAGFLFYTEANMG
jgi:hypothetical protein